MEAGREPSRAQSTCPQLLTNSVIDGLREKRNELVFEYQQKLETFKPSYPAMVQINNKIAEIDRQLATEVKTIKDSLKGSLRSLAWPRRRKCKKRIEMLRTRRPRSAEAQHPVQHPEARGGHQPLAL